MFLLQKPVGGVSVFASADLFGGQNINDILSNRQKQTKSKPSEKPTPAEEESKISQSMSANEINILGNKKPEVLPGKPTVTPEKPKLFDSTLDDVDATSHSRPIAGKLLVPTILEMISIQSRLHPLKSKSIFLRRMICSLVSLVIGVMLLR